MRMRSIKLKLHKKQVRWYLNKKLLYMWNYPYLLTIQKGHHESTSTTPQNYFQYMFNNLCGLGLAAEKQLHYFPFFSIVITLQEEKAQML